MEKTIPIIILNFNNFSHVKKNIESVMSNQNDNIVYKFIIIDNNSSDVEKKKLDEYIETYDSIKLILKDKNELKDKMIRFNKVDLQEKQVIYIKMKDNYGFSYSNNIGMKLAEYIGYRYCVISNPDTRVIDNESVKKIIYNN